jgi:hypothetical protein
MEAIVQAPLGDPLRRCPGPRVRRYFCDVERLRRGSSRVSRPILLRRLVFVVEAEDLALVDDVLP